MDEAAKRGAVRKYFAPFPKWAIWFLVIGLLVIVIGHRKGAAWGIGLLAMAVGGIVIGVSVGGKPSDEQMDGFRREDLGGISSRSLMKLGIDQSQCVREPVFVYGPGFGTGTECAKKGADNKIRYSPLDSTVIHFGENQLFAYACIFDMTTGYVTREATHEYFYRDVVSVQTKTESLSVVWRKQAIQLQTAETFTLTTSGGTAIHVVLGDVKLAQLMGGGELPTTEAEQAIQAVRTMLREKKKA